MSQPLPSSESQSISKHLSRLLASSAQDHCKKLSLSAQVHKPQPATTMPTTEAKGNKLNAISHPIECLNDPIAKAYTHIHPLIILGVFYFQFESLVENPVETLPKTALVVAALQILYLCLCIPASNHSSLHAKKPGQKKKVAGGPGEPGIGFKIVVCHIHCCCSLCYHSVCGIHLSGWLCFLHIAFRSTDQTASF